MEIDITVQTPRGKILFHETLKEEEINGKLKHLENRVLVSANMVFVKGKTVKDLVNLEVEETISEVTIVLK